MIMSRHKSPPKPVKIAIAKQDLPMFPSWYINYRGGREYKIKELPLSHRFAAKVRDKKGRYFYFTQEELERFF
jgi:hypothetical protein